MPYNILILIAVQSLHGVKLPIFVRWSPNFTCPHPSSNRSGAQLADDILRSTFVTHVMMGLGFGINADGKSAVVSRTHEILADFADAALGVAADGVLAGDTAIAEPTTRIVDPIVVGGEGEKQIAHGHLGLTTLPIGIIAVSSTLTILARKSFVAFDCLKVQRWNVPTTLARRTEFVLIIAFAVVLIVIAEVRIIVSHARRVVAKTCRYAAHV
jgi:hypothetical protein